jgi:hypothetical protein
MTIASPTSDSIAYLALAWGRLTRRFLPLVAALVAGLALMLLFNNPERLPIYFIAAGAGYAILAASNASSRAVLPVFPLYVLMQAFSFAAPLFAPEIVADRRLLISEELLGSCVLPLLLWFLALCLGWYFTPSGLGRMRPRRALTDALKNPRFLPHWSLALSAVLQFLLNSPFYWQLQGTLAQTLLTPLRTLIGLAGIAGAFTGAYAWSQGGLPKRSLWLVLLAVPVAGSLGSLLLSSLQGILFAALLGLWLGRSRQALAITLTGLVFISFLHAGKAAVREIYWGQGESVPSNPIELIQVWVASSLASVGQNGEAGPSNLLTDRFNNLQNLLYVQKELLDGTPELGGESFRSIPQAVVPRFLNTSKGRSQEGQVLLNLHFGRQRSIEDTETTYVAWGFLAEAVGNFGSTAGPLLMGIATGFLLRITENLGRGQLILSTPGLLSFALTVFWLTTYEMAASTFAAAVFQIVVVVVLVGWWFGRQSSRRSQLA